MPLKLVKNRDIRFKLQGKRYADDIRYLNDNNYYYLVELDHLIYLETLMTRNAEATQRVKKYEIKYNDFMKSLRDKYDYSEV
tara:strand:- start:1933 stop:2178 length:246 start_codon:yes stop_codon:yes gene_type:complete